MYLWKGLNYNNNNNSKAIVCCSVTKITWLRNSNATSFDKSVVHVQLPLSTLLPKKSKYFKLNAKSRTVYDCSLKCI